MFHYTVALIAAVGMLGVASALAEDPVGTAPGGMKLLTGYRHQSLQGIDTRVGKIWKKDGLTIHYDIGLLAGNYAKSQAKEAPVWHKEQVLGGRSVHLTFAKNKTLFVTLQEENANFYAAVKSEEDTADVLLMVLSYSPTEKPPK